ncbi:hypothetical protein D3C72_1859020 [compost metagenome]
MDTAILLTEKRAGLLSAGLGGWAAKRSCTSAKFMRPCALRVTRTASLSIWRKSTTGARCHTEAAEVLASICPSVTIGVLPSGSKMVRSFSVAASSNGRTCAAPSVTLRPSASVAFFSTRYLISGGPPK